MKILGFVTGCVLFTVFVVVFVYLSPEKNTAVELNGVESKPMHLANDGESAISPSSNHLKAISNQQPLNNNEEAAKLGLKTDPALIAQIEQEMQFSEAPEGDLSYMSPESETLQLPEDNFPGAAPDPTMTMPSNLSELEQKQVKNIGQSLEKNTKMDDLPLN